MGCCVSRPADHAPASSAVYASEKSDKASPPAEKLSVDDCKESNGLQQRMVNQKAPENHEAVDNGVDTQQDDACAEQSSPFMFVMKDTGCPQPLDEQHRWDRLVEYNILDTEPEEAYDRITELCVNLFKMPISCVTFVDKDRVWIKSVKGLSGLKQVERRCSLCAWTLLSRFPEALVVPDLREDVRFKDSPIVVGWPHLRFYAACPLVNADNVRLGTLCILDTKPGEFSAENATLLSQLANMVMREVERKRAMNDALCKAAVRQNSGNSITHDRQGLMLLDMAVPKWAIHLVNDAWQKITGISQEMAAGSHFWDLFEPPAPAQVQAYQLAVEQHRNFEMRVPCSNRSALPVPQTPDHCGMMTSNGSTISNPGDNSSTLGALDSGQWYISCASGPRTLEAGPAPAGNDSSRRRSISSMRYVRFQFRSISSVASNMGPAISIPPALLNGDQENNYYWATVDVPMATSQLGGDQSFGSAGGLQQSLTDQLAWSGRQFPGDSDGHSNSSGPQTVPGSECSLSMHSVMKTTFNLLPEDNPFQDITIGSLLGWGSYGRVHRGYWNGSLVAVKVLEQVAGDFNPRSSLEPLLHHRLSHPNIVAMYDVCTQEVDVCEDGRPLQEVWMVLEYCNRGTLSDAIQRGWLLSSCNGAPQPGVVNMFRALTTAREVAAALEYLHSQNVLHGDLNGNNILLAGAVVNVDNADQRGFTAKVADFGLSRILMPDKEQIITRTHGTITHMAPEVITDATHSKAADVYSFGVVLFELFSGSKPYHGMHYAQIVSSITSGKLLQLLPQQVSHLSEDLLQLMASCLASNSVERPTFAEVRQKLAQLEEQQLQQLPPGMVQPPVVASS